MTARSAPGDSRTPLRVLVVARAYPNPVLPNLGLWTERPTVLMSERCEIHVISPVPYYPPLPRVQKLAQYARFRDVPRYEKRNGVHVHHPRFVVGPGSTLYALESRAFHAGVRRTVDSLWRDHGFDLVHAHFIYPEGAAAARIAAHYGVPLLVSEHAPWRPWLDRFGVRREALFAARTAARLLPVSTSVRDTIAGYAPDTDTTVIPIGVDPKLFSPQREARDRARILFVGFPNFNKGVDVLLHAANLLRRDGVHARIEIVGAGHYHDTRVQEAELRRLAHELDLGGRIAFLGARPQEEVAKLMASSAVLVLPSRAESFGAVLIEALACGTPVVATRCGGPEDIVRDEVGVLVPTNDSRALADALASVLAHPDHYPAEDLRDYALSRFAWPLVVDRIHEEYCVAVDRADTRAMRPVPTT